MFANRIRNAGLTLAIAALAATTAMSPVAAAQDSGIEPVPLAQTDVNFVDMPSFLSDLVVTSVGKSTTGNAVTYRFRVRNLGPSPASQVGLLEAGMTCSIVPTPVDSCGNFTAGHPVVSLAAGETRAVEFTCTPDPGRYCQWGRLTAHHTNGSNLVDPTGNDSYATIS